MVRKGVRGWQSIMQKVCDIAQLVLEFVEQLLLVAVQLRPLLEAA